MHVGKTFAPINESKKYFKNSVLTSVITSSYIRQPKVIAAACGFLGGGSFGAPLYITANFPNLFFLYLEPF